MCAVLCGSVHEQSQPSEQGICLLWWSITGQHYWLPWKLFCWLPLRTYLIWSRFMLIGLCFPCVGYDCDGACNSKRLPWKEGKLSTSPIFSSFCDLARGLQCCRPNPRLQQFSGIRLASASEYKETGLHAPGHLFICSLNASQCCTALMKTSSGTMLVILYITVWLPPVYISMCAVYTLSRSVMWWSGVVCTTWVGSNLCGLQVLTTFGTALLALQPLQVPGWRCETAFSLSLFDIFIQNALE